MTVFLCILAACALFGFGDYTIKGAVSPWTMFALQSLSVVLTLGLAALALVSYLS